MCARSPTRKGGNTMKKVYHAQPESKVKVWDLLTNNPEAATMPIRKMMEVTGLSMAEVRYSLEDLEAEEAISKVCIVDKGPRYKRFKYEVLVGGK